MPRPPEAGDYLVIMGWSIEYIKKSPVNARGLAEALKQGNPQSRVVIAYVTEETALPELPPIRKEEI